MVQIKIDSAAISKMWCRRKVNTIRFTIDNNRLIFSSTGKPSRFGTQLFFIVLPVVLARLLLHKVRKNIESIHFLPEKLK